MTTAEIQAQYEAASREYDIAAAAARDARNIASARTTMFYTIDASHKEKKARGALEVREWYRKLLAA